MSLGVFQASPLPRWRERSNVKSLLSSTSTELTLRTLSRRRVNTAAAADEVRRRTAGMVASQIVLGRLWVSSEG
eukprot:scaffold6177_cov165-Skeletonema_marinoi.AAC.6